jgi:hypothetical protein
MSADVAFIDDGFPGIQMRDAFWSLIVAIMTVPVRINRAIFGAKLSTCDHYHWQFTDRLHPIRAGSLRGDEQNVQNPRISELTAAGVWPRQSTVKSGLGCQLCTLGQFCWIHNIQRVNK